MSNFCDLNLNVSNLSGKLIDQLVEHSLRLGYDILGLTVEYEFPEVASKGKDQGEKKKEPKQAISIPLAKPYKLPDHLQSRLDSCSRKIKIYSRITIKIKPTDINTHLQHLKSKPVQSYDLIALEPSDNQVLLYLCTNNFNADIITINSGIECGLTDKHLMRPLKNAINSFSLTFELNYSPSISSSTERRDFIMAGRCLSFNTKSKSLIISSGTSQKLNLRGPYELLSIAKLFDIKEQEAHEIVRRCPHTVITNSFCRKHTAAGMVYFSEPSDLKKLEMALVRFKQKSDEQQQELSEAITKSSGHEKEMVVVDEDDGNKIGIKKLKK